MSGLSSLEQRNLIKGAIAPSIREILCALEQKGAITLETLCDITTGTEVGYVVITFDPATSVKTITYYNINFVVIGAKPANSQVCQDQDIDVLVVQLCDDVNGDNTSIIRFKQFYHIDPSTAVRTVIGNWTDDLQSTYIPTNIIDCNPNPQYELVTGALGTWTMPTNTQSVSITVIQIGDAGNLPTITTDIGTHLIYSGQTVSFSAGTGYHEYLRATLTVDGNHANDIIGISYVAIRA